MPGGHRAGRPQPSCSSDCRRRNEPARKESASIAGVSVPTEVTKSGARPPDLDYAFLASWAGLQPDGTMTAVGMSFLRVSRQDTPMTLAVAGRVRLYDDASETQLTIRLVSPAGITVEVSNALKAAAGPDTQYGDNRRQVLFVLNTHAPIDHLGSYTVTIALDGVKVRELIFEVVKPPDHQA
jgi:hypothetical protein